MSEIGNEFERTVEIMRKLRSPQGCEWDRQQTHESLKPYIIEEAYELVEAIDERDAEKLKEELGDVLLQVLFHAHISAEENEFTITDVLKTLSDKLIRRHPHVFGNAKGYSYRQWERIKSEEKGKDTHSAIGDLNPALPSLSLARRVQENAAAVGFDWPSVSGALEKTKEEISELTEVMDVKEYRKIEEEVGDILFSIVNVARFLKVDPEIALRKATKKFIRRFQQVEKIVSEKNVDLRDLSLEDLDTLWEEVKGGETK
ncbi:MAG: nucleoside triphosphate pyrophosphohydrolase [Thermotogae bacterium]|nr:MAG: nucleoside triphosphate pyrophosphohydrolase [Thermotogota bacterium]